MEQERKTIMNRLREESRKTLRSLVVLPAILYGLSNCSSFTTVALEKYRGYSNEQAAFMNHLTTDFINQPGYSIGHKFFYEDSDYRKTGRNVLEKGYFE